MKEDDFYVKRFWPWFEDDVVLDLYFGIYFINIFCSLNAKHHPNLSWIYRSINR